MSGRLTSSHLITSHLISSRLVYPALLSAAHVSSSHVFSALKLTLRSSQLFSGPKPAPKPDLGAKAGTSSMLKPFRKRKAPKTRKILKN
jgi:hypothetical protein